MIAIHTTFEPGFGKPGVAARVMGVRAIWQDKISSEENHKNVAEKLAQELGILEGHELQGGELGPDQWAWVLVPNK